MDFDIRNIFGGSKESVFNAGIIIIALMLALRVYSGETKKIKKLQNEINKVTKKNAELTSLDKAKNRFETFKNKINGNKLIPTLINKISIIAKGSAVTISTIRPLQEDQQPFYTVYPFDLSVTAKNFHILGKFISKLESSPDIYFIHGISIKSISKGQAEVSVDNIGADLKLSTVLVTE